MKEHLSLKEKLTGALGTFGFVLFLLIQFFVSTLPLVMLPVKGFFLMFLIAFVMYVLPITDVIFWVWGLVCAIGGVQDWLAITSASPSSSSPPSSALSCPSLID